MLRKIYLALLAAACLALDYLSGPSIQFPVLYLFPVSLGSWFEGRTFGLTLAVLLPLLRLAMRFSWDSAWTWAAIANAGIRILVFTVLAWFIARTATQMHELRHMRMLEMMLGVCSVCGEIHDKKADVWQTLDTYVTIHQREFERELCPDCQERVAQAFDRR